MLNNILYLSHYYLYYGDPLLTSKRVRLLFLDLVGVLRGTEISYSEDKSVFKTLFDASSVYGFEEIHESDLEVRIPVNELKKHPWNENLYMGIARIYYPDGKRYIKDPRFIAEKTMEFVKEQGYDVKIGVEIEFFLFNDLKAYVDLKQQYIRVYSDEIPSKGIIPPRKGYHLVEPIDTVSLIREDIIDFMEKLGYGISKSHHEVATAGQVEVTSKAYGLVDACDYTVWFKYAARSVAEENGYIAVFLPKPLPGDNGSGMHIHTSLWSNDKNLFYDPEDKYGLSQLARYFIGGLLEHGRSLSAIVSPTVNSYRRLVPGFEAPTILAWDVGNRSIAVRIPRIRDEKSFRIEYRPPDPLANPYLALSAIVLAGLDGIKKKIDPGEPFPGDAYKYSEKELKKMGYKQLPRNLEEALDELENDHEYLKPVFPEKLIESYIEIKRREAREIQAIPTPQEYIYYNYW